MRVARLLSFSGAARELGVAPSVITKRISQLEKALGVRLVNRSTRGLTEALDVAAQASAEVDRLWRCIGAEYGLSDRPVALRDMPAMAPAWFNGTNGALVHSFWLDVARTFGLLPPDAAAQERSRAERAKQSMART